MASFDGGASEFVPPVRRRTNVVGLVGFLISLVGVLGGCVGAVVVSPVGLVVSLAGLLRRPRGFAAAGVVLGLLGTLWLALAIVLMGGVVMVFSAAVGAATEGAVFSVTERCVRDYNAERGHPPASIDELLKGGFLRDAPSLYGEPVTMRVESSMRVVLLSAGPDRLMGTRDDRERVILLREPPAKPAAGAPALPGSN
ncbi:MAG: hypothetical protein K2X32_04905, partial [Phycisphaerales bacterium]|nr:hypothetical protein [Phycisphaerales bacterium]